MSVSQPEETASEGASDHENSTQVPRALWVAGGVALLEGLALVVYGVAEIVTLDAGRAVMGATVAVFFLAFGGLLVACGWGLTRVRPWARGPVLMAQLIALGLAWNFRAGATLPVAIGLAVVAVVALAGLLNRSSVEAVERASTRR